jgi:acyl-CoA dehydrogenase
MPDRSYLTWPFFTPEHREIAGTAAEWAAAKVPGLIDHEDADATCRALVRALGEAGLLAHAVPAPHGGARDSLDVRTLCLIRETLAYQHGLADFAFAMQGLGSAPVSLYGSDELKARILPAVAEGEGIAAFALSEADAGSDVAAIATTARPEGNGQYRIDGEKTWISNGGIAAHYIVFARTGEGEGARGLSAFLVDADAPGLEVAERLDLMAPHPMARLRFDGCRVPANHLLGKPGEGFKVAMATLDVFRSTVGAAALGLARRAFDEALGRVTTRTHVRRAAERSPAHPGRDRRHGDGDRRDGASRLPRRLGQGCRRPPRHPRGRHGQALCRRQRAPGDRPGGADVRRARRVEGEQGRGALPRGPRAQDLRRRERGAKARHRPPGPRRVGGGSTAS